jgi:hypothetical protein
VTVLGTGHSSQQKVETRPTAHQVCVEIIHTWSRIGIYMSTMDSKTIGSSSKQTSHLVPQHKPVAEGNTVNKSAMPFANEPPASASSTESSRLTIARESRKLAETASALYQQRCDVCLSHRENVWLHLSDIVASFTVVILCPKPSTSTSTDTSGLPPESTPLPVDVNNELREIRNLVDTDETLSYLMASPDSVALLSRRDRARLDAFLSGVELSVSANASYSRPVASPDTRADTPPSVNKSVDDPHVEASGGSLSLAEGLAGFLISNGSDSASQPKQSPKRPDNEALRLESVPRLSSKIAPILESVKASSQKLLGSFSTVSTVVTPAPGLRRKGSMEPANKPPLFRQYRQISADDLTRRLEIYFRSLYRLMVQKSDALATDCVVASESVGSLKARTAALINAFVDTVGAIHQQSPVLTRLLESLTSELLAVDVLAEVCLKAIRRLVSEYQHRTSFASLAFLSSPENAAHDLLTPMVMQYLLFLKQSFVAWESECELERSLRQTLDGEMRRVFKTTEFRSIGHLLEVCQNYRHELQRIEFPDSFAALRASSTKSCTSGADPVALRQAVRDLQRETITVNGQLLPPARNRRELVHLLAQTLNARVLAAKLSPRPTFKGSKRTSRKLVGDESDMSSEAGAADRFNSASQSGSILHSLIDSDSSEPSGLDGSPTASRRKTADHSGSSGYFHESTVDFLIQRLLLASGRTDQSGDAYLVVRDLFGGDDVDVIPSRFLPRHGRATRPGTIEILVRLASVTIKVHSSFDVYPSSLVGECEPLIQLHTTTTEVIGLHEVRHSDVASAKGTDEAEQCNGDGFDEEEERVLVLLERQTEHTGRRILCIRPALYETGDA